MILTFLHTPLLYTCWGFVHLLQRKYILKFATDGAVLTNTKNAVQGVMKLIPSDENGKVIAVDDFPQYMDKEITLYYYIGNCYMYLRIHLNNNIRSTSRQH